MQILVFAGDYHYPKAHLHDFRGMMPVPVDLANMDMPSGMDIATYLQSLHTPGQSKVSWLAVLEWVTVLVVDGQSIPRRQGWDIVLPRRDDPDPVGHMKARGCTGWFQVTDIWVGLRLQNDIELELTYPINKELF